MRRALSSIAVLLLGLASVELGVQLWFRYQFHAWYSPQALADLFSTSVQIAGRRSADPGGEFATQVIHPYVGYVYNSQQVQEEFSSLQPGWTQDSTNGFDRVTAAHDVTIHSTADGLDVTSTGNDPYVFIRTEPLSPARAHVISITVDADAAALLQFFHKTAEDAGFGLQRSKTLLLNKGRNTAMFRLAEDTPIDALRADFGDAPGHFVVRSITYEFADKTVSDDREHANATLGFLRNREGVPFAPDPSHVSILVTGGSVAEGLGIGGFLEDAYVRNMPASVSAHRKPLIFTAAIGGYKQPQQLMTLAYLLSLGASFDIIINIDGFNEAALPYSENYLNGLDPTFPRAWALRIGERGRASKVAGEMSYLDFRKETEVAALRSGGRYRLATFGLYVLFELNEIARRIAVLSGIAQADADFEHTGPYRAGRSMDEVIADSADEWLRASRLMAAMAARNGIDYVHVLQPNQYVDGSKPLSDEERAIYYLPESPMGKAARAGYRALVERAKDSQITNFLDATGLFRETPETIYVDSCCHYNKAGYDRLADFIMQAVAQRATRLTDQSASPKQQAGP